MQKEFDKAKEIIQEEIGKAGLKIERIILFGSRARGDYSEDSDWDILVILKNEFTREVKRRTLRNIYSGLAGLENSYEIILMSKRDFERMKDIVGSLSYAAELEGITI